MAMKKRLFALFLVFLFPASYFTFGKFINFDTMSAILFLLIILFLVIRYRKILEFQAMVKIFKIPVIYAVLWKTKFGLRFMDRIASKYREIVKLIAYCFIGFGFAGMIMISGYILLLLFRLFMTPRTASQEVALVLPLTNIPGAGYLSFWHFLLTLFITVLIHEFAHGIVARAHKVPVKTSGLGVFSIVAPIFPLAFVEPDEKKLEKEKDIVQYSIFSAGPVINIIFAFLVLFVSIYALVPIEENITHPIGFTFNDLMENYSAERQGMQPGMIINEVDGKEVLTYQEFASEVEGLKPGDQIEIGTDNGTFNLMAKASPENPLEGYIGILSIYNERRVNEGFEGLGKVFFWLQGLFKWMFFINFAIGLMNLLPLLITDGGRMLKTAFERIFAKKATADKAWAFIGGLFLFTLLFAMLLRYVILPGMSFLGI